MYLYTLNWYIGTFLIYNVAIYINIVIPIGYITLIFLRILIIIITLEVKSINE